MENILICTGHELLYRDIIKAENCTLYDSRGNRYLDLESGIWCTSVGHSHPRITNTIREQSGKIIHTGFCYLNPNVENAATKLLRITGLNKGKCIFFCSGSEAVELAVKITQSISEQPFILTMKDSYLSAFGSAGSKSKDHWILFDWMSNEKMDSIPFEKISAFIFEPGSSGGLVRFPPMDLIEEIVNKIRANNGIIIANEVTTGMGRTGEWFGYNHYDLVPDIIAIGKGLGNGYPVSCTVLSQTILQKLTLNKFYYSQSHQNDPLGAAIASEVISIIEDHNLIMSSKVKGEEIKTRLNIIKEQYGIVKEIRGRGLMIAVEFEKNGNLSYAEKINLELLKRKIILVRKPGSEVIRIDPCLTIEKQEIDYFLNSMEEIISKIAEQTSKTK